MCAVSAVYDYGRENNIQWSQETYRKYLELLEAARQFDVAAGQIDCEDPEKARFLQAVEKQAQTEVKE